MDRRAIWEKWKTDYDFKTLTGSGWSLAVTLVFALYHGYLGIAHHSGWYGSVCVYYLMLAAVRFVLLDTERRVLRKPEKKTDASRRRTYRWATGLLLVLNLALVAVLTLQNTLIMVNGGDADRSLLPVTATSSFFIWGTIVVLSVLSFADSLKASAKREVSTWP